jgi:hypothetical protein
MRKKDTELSWQLIKFLPAEIPAPNSKPKYLGSITYLSTLQWIPRNWQKKNCSEFGFPVNAAFRDRYVIKFLPAVACVGCPNSLNAREVTFSTSLSCMDERTKAVRNQFLTKLAHSLPK